MKSRIVPVDLITSPYISMRHSYVALTITDNSEREYTNVEAVNYGCYQPMFAPKGITNQLIFFEGDDVVNKFTTMFGTPDTGKYGPMFTYALEILKSGFTLGTINIRPQEATYPNFYLGLNIGAVEDEATGKPKTTTLYIEYEADEDYYHMDMVKDRLPNKDAIIEVEFPVIEAKFDNYCIDGLTRDTDIDEYLGKTAVKLSVDGGDVVTLNDYIHVPLIGLAYRGAGDYNNFRAVFNNDQGLLNSNYPIFGCTIYDGSTQKYNFNFCLFDVANEYNVNQSFENRGTATCKVVFNESTKNSVQEFRPYSLSKKIANKITAGVEDVCNKFQADLLRRVKEQIPTFDPDASQSDWYNIISYYTYLISVFTKNEANKSLETPLSRTNPFALSYVGGFNDSPILIKCASAVQKFSGGTMGPLSDILDEEGFSFDIMLDVPSEEDVIILDSLTVESGSVEIGTPFTFTVTLSTEPAQQTQFFVDELKRCYGGDIDPAVLDPSFMRDAIIFGEWYPNELQEHIAEFVRYHDGNINYDGGRCDMTYIRTPPLSVTTIDEAIEWAQSFGSNKNMNMHTVIGRWSFTDPSTGSSEKFSAFFDYLGSNAVLYNYLTSYTPDSIASGSYSEIISGAENTQELVPKTKTERETLAKADVMFYARKSNGNYALSEDSAHIPDIDSVMKNVGSCVHFNKMINRLYCFARDNKIVNATDENLTILKTKAYDLISEIAAAFNDNITLSTLLSDHEYEKDSDVVLYQLNVIGHSYSRHARVDAIIERSDSSSS